jgi:hypothetical protein
VRPRNRRRRRGAGRQRNDRSAEELCEALVLAGAAGLIGSPVSHDPLLKLFVETVAAVIPSASAYLFLIDEDRTLEPRGVR